MRALIEQQYDFKSIRIKKLDGYDNANYLIESDKGTFIFKTYPHSEELLDLVQAETDILLSIQDTFSGLIPQPIHNKFGCFVSVEMHNGNPLICRLLSYLEGLPLGSLESSHAIYAQLGRFLARLDKRLLKVKNYVIQSRKWEWDIQYFHLSLPYLNDIPSARDRNTVRYFFQQFEENVVPVLPELRRSIIYNDANEHNILFTGDKFSGLIDFGDLAYSPLINELAIAITYAIYDKEEPIDWAVHLLKSYHAVLPLEELEIKILYYLIAARLCISVCNSAHARLIDPENTYATNSEKKVWNMMYKWLKTNPVEAENTFRKAINLPKQEIPTIKNRISYRHSFLSPILSVSYKNPVYVKKAAFQYMYDAYGNTLLDAYNNIPHVGHSHPKVVEAGQRQMCHLNTNTRYLYDVLPEYAEKLLRLFPPTLNRVFFVNSGSAASDLAIRMARFHTGAEHIMVIEHGYHGNTQTSIDISDYKFNNPKGQGKKASIIKLPIPDTFRGKYSLKDESAGIAYAQDAIFQIQKTQKKKAAFIAEPIVGCGGQVPLAKGYLKTLYPAVRKQGCVCISDEVQTGFGRLGDYFWGYEAQEVVPDMVILGKPMGNGHPMGAVVCTSEIAESFSKGVEFFSSFGGNPVSCAIGLAVLDVIDEEGLQQQAKETGDYYASLFRELQKRHSCIGDVRGSGLFLGVEFIKPGTKEPDTELASYVKNELRNRFVLVSTDGPFDNVIKTKPPLIFTKANAQEVVEKMDRVLSIL